jgi:hypothetical protein
VTAQRIEEAADVLFCRALNVSKATALELATAVLKPSLDHISKLEGERDRLREALVYHNDALRSAQQVAQREGKDTNWLSFRGQTTMVLAEYHEITNEARAALNGSPPSDNKGKNDVYREA